MTLAVTPASSPNQPQAEGERPAGSSGWHRRDTGRPACHPHLTAAATGPGQRPRCQPRWHCRWPGAGPTAELGVAQWRSLPSSGLPMPVAPDGCGPDPQRRMPPSQPRRGPAAVARGGAMTRPGSCWHSGSARIQVIGRRRRAAASVSLCPEVRVRVCQGRASSASATASRDARRSRPLQASTAAAGREGRGRRHLPDSGSVTMTSSARTRTWQPATSGAPLVSSESAIPPIDEAG